MYKISFILFLLSFFTSKNNISETRTITGTVILSDTYDLAIGAEVVVINNESYKTTVNSLGEFSLDVPDNATELKITYEGYSSKEISITDKNHFEYILLSKDENFKKITCDLVYFFDTYENAIGADIVLLDDGNYKTKVDSLGRFSLIVPVNSTRLKITHEGYTPKEISIISKKYFESISLGSLENFDTNNPDGKFQVDTFISFDPMTYEETIEVVYNDRISEEDEIIMSTPTSAYPSSALPPPPVIEEVPSNENKDTKKITTWKRSNKIDNTATLKIGENDYLESKGSQVAITIEGFRARVLLDYFFYNDRETNLEGTFKMKLPQGAKPYYLAFGESVYKNKDEEEIPFVSYEQIDFSSEGIENMRSDSWSSPKEAKIVEKEKAAFAYHSEVRKSVDPALAEWAGSDIYNCKVFPLVAKKLHRIVIGYDVNLLQAGNNMVFNFGIPKKQGNTIIDINILNNDDAALEIFPKGNIKNSDRYKRIRYTNPIEDEIKINFIGLENVFMKSLAHEKEKYFASSFIPQLPVSKNTNVSKKAIFALDVSLSSQPDKFNIWLKMIERILKNNKDAIKEFNVICFNIESFWWKEKMVKNNDKNINHFLSFAHNLILEGASDLGEVLKEINQKEKDRNIFLMSDASVTWGVNDNYELSHFIQGNNNIIYSYNTGMSGTGISLLQHLARETGGSIFSVMGEDEINKASTAFRNQPWEIQSVKLDGTKDIILNGRPKYIYNHQKLNLAARIEGKLSKNIILELSQNNIKKQIKIPIKKIQSSNLSARIYGQMATEQLEELGDATRDISVSYSKHFKVPGKTCSLLMLETEEDYKAYDINKEDNYFVVKELLAAEEIKKILNKLVDNFINPKENFISELNQLEKIPDVGFQKKKIYDILINRMSEEDFRITSKGLNCKIRTLENVNNLLIDELLKEQLNYDTIELLAQKRKKNISSDDALKLLSSLLEKNPSDMVLARDIAYSAMNWDLNHQAYFLLKRSIESRPFEPQGYYMIAKILDKIEKNELALLYYEIAYNGKWNQRFGAFNQIVGIEYLRFLQKNINNKDFKFIDFAKEKIKTLQKEHQFSDTDIVVVIAWNTDNTDIDLHVLEPNGEECYYQNKKTTSGGTITQDVTGGYGPEMYVLKKAPNGKYKIQVKLYSSDNNKTSLRTKVLATVYQNFGKENEKTNTKTVKLIQSKELQEIMILDY